MNDNVLMLNVTASMAVMQNRIENIMFEMFGFNLKSDGWCVQKLMRLAVRLRELICTDC